MSLFNHRNTFKKIKGTTFSPQSATFTSPSSLQFKGYWKITDSDVTAFFQIQGGGGNGAPTPGGGAGGGGGGGGGGAGISTITIGFQPYAISVGGGGGNSQIATSPNNYIRGNSGGGGNSGFYQMAAGNGGGGGSVSVVGAFRTFSNTSVVPGQPVFGVSGNSEMVWKSMGWRKS
jgi:hypothetical protein